MVLLPEVFLHIFCCVWYFFLDHPERTAIILLLFYFHTPALFAFSPLSSSSKSRGFFIDNVAAPKEDRAGHE
jgi:hypothetical protein